MTSIRFLVNILLDENQQNAGNAENDRAFEIGAVWKLSHGRVFVHWFGYDNVDDMTVEPESQVMMYLVKTQKDSLLAEYPWKSGDEAVAVNPKDKMVCKRTQRTGTRFYDKICKTAGQWDAIAEEHRRNLSETVDRPQVEIRRE